MTKTVLLLISVTSYNYRVLCVYVNKSFIKRKCTSLTTEGWPPGRRTLHGARPQENAAKARPPEASTFTIVHCSPWLCNHDCP